MRRIYLLADIEGSSGCFDYESSSFMNEKWAMACVDMTLDVNSAVSALFEAGAEIVTVRDYHRTCMNILPSLLDPRARLIKGFHSGEVLGIGNVSGHDTAFFLGMHASSGSGGFLAHTLTSRYSRITIDGRPLSELELFEGMLSLYGIRPSFFSGCPVACREAGHLIEGIPTYSIDKSGGKERFDKAAWRKGLSDAVQSAFRKTAPDYHPAPGPCEVRLQMRDGYMAARKLASAWKLEQSGNTVTFRAQGIADCYTKLIHISYSKPYLSSIAPALLGLINIPGMIGLRYAEKRARKANY